MILPFCCTLTRPHLECWVQLSAEEEHLGLGPEEGQEDYQRAGAYLLWRKAGRIGIFQLGKEKSLGRPYCNLLVSKEPYKKARDKCFSRAYWDKTKVSGFKLKEGHFRLDLGKKFFHNKSDKTTAFWPGVMDAPSLNTLKVRLDGVLGNLI